MTHSFDIIFDPKPAREQRVLPLFCVVTPVDRFTGDIIIRGITAEIQRLRIKARRSLRGHLYFENLIDPTKSPPAPPDFPIEVAIDASDSGYFPFEEPHKINAAQDLGKHRVGHVQFDLRPERVLDGETAVIRGTVFDAADERLDNAAVYGRVTGGSTFQTRTDANGTFALRFRLPALSAMATAEVIPATGEIKVQAEKGSATSNERTLAVTDMTTQSGIELKLT